MALMVVSSPATSIETASSFLPRAIAREMTPSMSMIEVIIGQLRRFQRTCPFPTILVSFWATYIPIGATSVIPVEVFAPLSDNKPILSVYLHVI